MKINNQVKATIQKVTWDKARKEVEKANPKLYQLIDNLSPSNKYPLFRASYPFGAESVQKGCLYLPDDSGQLVRHDSSALNQSLRALAYNLGSNPVSLVLNNSFEIYLQMNGYTIPFALVPKGGLFSTGLVLNPTGNQQPAFLWHVSAGARSLFMLSKISIERQHEQLKKSFGVEIDKPEHFIDHGKVFRALYASQDFNSQWTTDVLYFGKQWFEHLNDPAWVHFAKHLYETCWKGSEFWRNEFLWNLVFSMIQKRRNLKPNPYISDTVKHLLAMSIGAYPGFAPAIDNALAPIERLQEIYADIYELENVPIIMQPTYLNQKNPERPIYYSLTYPTTISFSPKSRRNANKISELKEIQHVLKKYIEQIANSEFNIHDVPLAKVPQTIKFDCFHTSQISKEIRDGALIFQEDSTFSKLPMKKQDYNFPKKSPFLRGCVRIAPITKSENS